METVALLEFTKTLLEADNLSSAVATIYQKCKEITGGESGYLVLTDDSGAENGIMYLDAGNHQGSGNWDLDMTSRCLGAEVFRIGEAIFDNDFSHSPYRQFVPEGHPGIDNVLFTPISANGKTIGLLGLANKRGGFTPGDRQTASAFGAVAAAAIMQRRRQQSAKQPDHIRLDRAIERAEEGLGIVSSNGVIEYVNEALCSMTGYESDDLIGRPFKLLWSDTCGEEFHRAVRETLEAGKAWSVRVTGRKKDGTSFEHEERFSPIRDDSGKTMRYFLIARDLTEDIKTERYLQQCRKMEAVITLATGVAHDLANICTAVVGFSEMALNKSNEPLVKRRIEHALKAGMRGRELVDQILSFSVDKKQEKKPIRLSEAIAGTIEILRVSFPSKVEIRYNIRSESGSILADPAQINQVLLDLAWNALHAVQETDGMIEVTVEDFTLTPASRPPHPDMKPGSYISLSMRDSGCGMDRCVLEQAFEPFFTTRKTGESKGLGLSRVYNIVKSHQGAITADSEPGKGSVFTIFFPLVNSDVTDRKGQR
ncbi:MAG: Blue-light-activated protein [Syntrophorhabdaceae bacterium PtaU1.Bin034]|nr:MAG: Blue-light-activated protein [Syntrophorhabdaceae bacterium PtaU1.Bin034]